MFYFDVNQRFAGQPEGPIIDILSSISAKLKYWNFHDYYLLYFYVKRNRFVKILSKYSQKITSNPINKYC